MVLSPLGSFESLMRRGRYKEGWYVCLSPMVIQSGGFNVRVGTDSDDGNVAGLWFSHGNAGVHFREQVCSYRPGMDSTGARPDAGRPGCCSTIFVYASLGADDPGAAIFVYGNGNFFWRANM